MAEFDNTNSGALFKNDKKTKESQPDYKGNINVDGTEYWISAWIKTSRAGQKFMSLALTPKDERPVSTVVDDSDIPF
jgi:uncharacterized protein (DUF736 family)